LAFTASLLPEDKPRYVMGIGTPEYILEAIGNGIDMFDCVLPTRTGRNGRVFTHNGPFSIKKAENALDMRPIDEACSCKVCRTYSRAYLRHLFKTGEILCSMLASYHNLYFLFKLVEEAKNAVHEGTFTEYKKKFLRRYHGGM
jgi:queuine tRNA-ribosyltransferase